MFQDPFAVYNPFYRVDHALTEPLHLFGLAGSRGEARAMMEAACTRVGLNPTDTLGRFPHQLSGGQRQRLMVARALLLRPKLLIADEPVSMIDASLRALVLGSLRALNAEMAIPILYITHDLTTAHHIADTIIVLYRGSVVEAGDAAAVIRSPRHPYTRLLVDSIPVAGPGSSVGRRAAWRRLPSRHVQRPARPRLRGPLPAGDAALPGCDAAGAVPAAGPAPGRALLPASKRRRATIASRAQRPSLQTAAPDTNTHKEPTPMKITAVKTVVVAAPPHRNWVFVKVETDQPGLYGWGEGTLEWKTRAVVGMVEDLAPIVVGQDPRDITRLVELMNRTSFWPLGVIGLTALSAIEQAAWDILGKSLGQPVWALLGGKVRDRVRVYTHIGAGQVKIKNAGTAATSLSYVESTRELREQGYTAVKTGPVPYTHYDFDMTEVMHTGRLLEGLRDAAGDEMDILLDFHGRPSSPARAQLALYRRLRAGAPDVRGGADPARRPRRDGADRRGRRLPDRHRRASGDASRVRGALPSARGHLRAALGSVPLRRLHGGQADRGDGGELRHRRLARTTRWGRSPAWFLACISVPRCRISSSSRKSLDRCRGTTRS